jgi:hypothetical protein
MALAQPVSQAALQVVGVCGHTVEVVVGEAVVSFTCLPAVSGPPEQGTPVFSPRDPRAPNTALVTEINLEGLDPGTLMGRTELDAEADPLIVNVRAGDQIAGTDLGNVLASAREEGRAVRLEIG